MANKFDFNQCDRLLEVIYRIINQLDVQNGQMEKRFTNLNDYFKDSRYDEYKLDMDKADKQIHEVVEQMKAVAHAIQAYRDHLIDAV